MWSFGVATADYDNDGDTDIYLANWGAKPKDTEQGDLPMKFPLFIVTTLYLTVLPAAAQEEAAWKKLPATKIGPAIEQAIESHPNLVYAGYGDRKMELDLYRPVERKGPLPAIVCIHGGGWHKGTRLNHAHIAKALAARGY